MTAPRFELVGGRLTRDGEPFVLHGVVYHPSGTGTAMWRDTSAQASRDAMARDFAAIADRGFNTVRLFLYWRDAQPTEHEISAEVLSRLRGSLDEAASHGLASLVSLLTIFMNGELLDLPWRGQRDLWRDPDMLAAQERYVAAVAAALAGSPGLLGFDLGDEIPAVAPHAAATLSAGEVAAWYARLRAAIHRQAPGVLVTQANNSAAVFGQTAFTVSGSGPLDLIAIHGYPSWSPGTIESSASVKATNLVPFLAAVAGAYRPALIDELACYGAGDEISAGYLGAAAVSAVANGAIGFIVWCWQDLEYAGEPFGERPLERFMGLLRRDGSAKPTLAAVAGAIRATRRLAPAAAGAVALYLPERLTRARHSYLDADSGAVAAFYGYLLLKRAHLHFEVAAERLERYRLIVCPGPAHLTQADLRRLGDAAHRGATVYLSLGDPLHGFPGTELTGAAVVDFSLLPGQRDHFSWGAEDWPVAWTPQTLPALTVTTPAGAVLAAFPDGTPAVVSHSLGAGRVVFCTAPFERQLDAPGRLELLPWHRLYARLAELAGVQPHVWCDEPDVELVPLRHGRRALAVNHSAAVVTATISWRTGGEQIVQLDGKGWRIFDEEGRN